MCNLVLTELSDETRRDRFTLSRLRRVQSPNCCLFFMRLRDRRTLMMAVGGNGVQKPRGGANGVDCANI